MTAANQETPLSDVQWYLARDGKQHGPLTNAEMTKLVELGHLRASDLVWRAGFQDWRTATSVFPEMASPAPPRPPAAPQPAPAAQPVAAATTYAGAATQPEPQTARPKETAAAASPYAPPQEMLEPQVARPTASTYAEPRGFGIEPAASSYGAPPRTMAPAPRGASRYGDPQFDPREDDAGYVYDRALPHRSRKGFLLGVLTTLAVVVSVGWLMKDPLLAALKGDVAKKTAERMPPPNVVAPATPTRTAAEPAAATATSAIGGPSAIASLESASRQLDGPAPRNATDIDAELQSRRLWVAVKQDFPEWYSVRLNEAARLAADGKSRADIMRHLVEALVSMRRDNASHALAASSAKHRLLATAFLTNLKQLSQESSQACYDFISKGELSQTIVSRMQQPDQAAGIESQLAVILSAITEGRKSPVTHAAPGKADYDILATELSRIGWSQADMQLFADPKALAKASHEKVCKMLQDWFTAHLAVPDPKVQERLLFETLKPVVSG